MEIVVRIENAAGQRIMSVHEWGQLAPPAHAGHWRRFRSAMESAESWFRDGTGATPAELQQLLDSDQETAGCRATRVVPEVHVQFDNFGGNNRNSDVIVEAVRGDRRILLSIEAKADERFGNSTIGNAYSNANQDGNVKARIEHLLSAVFGVTVASVQEIPVQLGNLRYQLLYSVAASVVAAADRNADFAVFAVHEFLTPHLNGQQILANAEDFRAFIAALPGVVAAQVNVGQLVGPICLPGNEFISNQIPLLLGKAVSTVTTLR